jgi:hypothetical protein
MKVIFKVGILSRFQVKYPLRSINKELQPINHICKPSGSACCPLKRVQFFSWYISVELLIILSSLSSSVPPLSDTRSMAVRTQHKIPHPSLK